MVSQQQMLESRFCACLSPSANRTTCYVPVSIPGVAVSVAAQAMQGGNPTPWSAHPPPQNFRKGLPKNGGSDLSISWQANNSSSSSSSSNGSKKIWESSSRTCRTMTRGLRSWSGLRISPGRLRRLAQAASTTARCAVWCKRRPA
jgi:hypothetical protein